jgi:hypothetical protein
MDRDRSDWTSWATRILNEDGHDIMEICQYLKDKGKLNTIQKVDKYSITRFALLSLLKTLRKMSVPEKNHIINTD